MLNEPASSANRLPIPAVQPARDVGDSQLNQIRDMVSTVLMIEREVTPDPDRAPSDDRMLLMAQGSHLLVTFEGRLLIDSEPAYDNLDRLLAPLNRLALFRESGGKHVVHILAGRANPKPRAIWINIALLAVTLFSVLLVGLDVAVRDIATRNFFLAAAIARNGFAEIWRGLPYALSIMLILGAHELGHYFAARRHNIAVTLPYFIPLPFVSPFGTLGAYIQLRQPIRNRKILMDVGAAGPLAGLVFAVPILLIGLANAPLHPLNSMGGLYEGDSILYALAKTFTYGHFVPDGERDVCVNCNQLAWAGWTGLFVTGLNLFPLGQLDGGHIVYAAFGGRARRLYYPLIGLMVGLTLLVSTTWSLWLVLLILLGRFYAVPLDAITPLDRPRRMVATLSLIAFALAFVPAPMTPVGGGGLFNGGSLALVTPALFLAARRVLP